MLIACGGVALSSTDVLAAKAGTRQGALPLLPERYVNFGGFFWKVRDTHGLPQTPSGGAWSPSNDNVWVDARGGLHLRITVVNGKRVSAQLTSVTPFSYGTYRWKVKLNSSKLDPRLVLGLFTYGPSTRGTPNEIDIEHGRFFGYKDGSTSQFVVQPFGPTGHLHRFSVPSRDVERIEQVVWQPRRVDFTISDANNPTAPPIAHWTFNRATEVPVFRGDKLNMNFWSFPPAKGTPLKPVIDEAVIESFTFTPMIPTGLQDIPAS